MDELNSISNDLYDEYIIGIPESELTNEEKEKKTQIENNKKIYKKYFLIDLI